MKINLRIFSIRWAQNAKLMYFLLSAGYIFMLNYVVTASRGHCRVEECAHWFTKTKQYEYLVEGKNERFCQLLQQHRDCLEESYQACRGSIKFHSSLYAARKQWKDLDCVSINTRRSSGENRCYFNPAATQRSVRYCALFGAGHVRAMNGSIFTCQDTGAQPLANNRYFLVQVTQTSHEEAPLTSYVSRLTVLIRKHNCTRQLLYQTSSDEEHLPFSFDDGSTHVTVDGDRRSIEVLRQGVDYVELNLRYIDASIHIRKSGPYLSVAIRGPEFVLKSFSSNLDQLCWTGCSRSKLSIENVFAAPKEFAQCQGRKTTEIDSRLAQERCRSIGVVDSFFDACVFDFMLTGDERLATSSQLAQSDFRRVFPLHYHYVQGRDQLVLATGNVTSSFENCIPSSSTHRYCIFALLISLNFLLF